MNNFTPRAQQVLALARKEADRFNHNYVGTEHLLLGLIKLGQGVAVSVLERMGLDLESVRMEVEKQVGTGPDQKITGNIPYTPRVKKVLALANKEAKALTHSYVGTEHILLGLLREGEGVAARVLQTLDVDIARTRNEILAEIDPNFTPEDPDDEFEGFEDEGDPEGGEGEGKTKTPCSACLWSRPGLNWLGTTNSIRSLFRSQNWSGWCRSFADARRTTRSSLVRPGLVRRQSWRAWPRRLHPAMFPRFCGIRR